MTVAEQKSPMEFKFNSTNQTIRVEMVNNQPYFIAVDVCEALALSHTTNTIAKLDDDEKLSVKLLHAGQHRELLAVNESGLYNLIFRSNKPEAKVFRKWVTAEVLPAIRKKGYYTPKGGVGLPPGTPCKHNRLTKDRMIEILADVAKIENTILRLSIVDKLNGGQRV